MASLISKNERIFIAGGHGMVGSSIFKKLLEEGYGKKSLGGWILRPSRKELDLMNEDELKKWFEINNPSVVIIAAAKVGGILANSSYPTEFILENLKIQNNLIEISKNYNVKRLLFLGSSCIYPKHSKQPIKEEYLLSDELEITNQFYAIAKIAGIKLCEALNIQYNFDSICLMPTNLYGPNDNYHGFNSHVIPALIKKFYEASLNNHEKVVCWGSGKPLREFLYVEDLAEACIFALENWKPNYDKYNINNKKNPQCWINVGSKFEITIRDLANIISTEFNYKGQIEWDTSKPDGTPRKKLDTRKMTSLGWEAKTNLKTGLKKTISSFKKEYNSKI